MLILLINVVPNVTDLKLSFRLTNVTNAAYVEDMYLSWMEDSKSVHSSWNAYFKQVEAEVKRYLALENLIRAYQSRSHLMDDSGGGRVSSKLMI